MTSLFQMTAAPNGPMQVSVIGTHDRRTLTLVIRIWGCVRLGTTWRVPPPYVFHHSYIGE